MKTALFTSITLGMACLLLCGCQTPEDRMANQMEQMERQMEQMQKMMDRMAEKMDAMAK